MPVGRPCSLHGFNWALCALHRAHQGECGYETSDKPSCTGFQPCDPTATCSCDKCKDVAKLSELCWKCGECGAIDSELQRLRCSCPVCHYSEYDKSSFLGRYIEEGRKTSRPRGLLRKA